jgi:DNA-binding MltR family transcriptional regulator
MKSELRPEDLLRYLDENRKQWKKLVDLLVAENARGCALVAGALLDERLLELIQARMVPRATANKFDSFFGGYGPLATFAARTHLAYLLGFIADNVYQDLCVIRDVRNRFAHSAEDIDFNDNKIKTGCAKLLHYAKQRASEPQAQFIFATATLGLVFEYLIFDSKRATTPANGPEEISAILDKHRDLYAANLSGISPEAVAEFLKEREHN